MIKRPLGEPYNPMLFWSGLATSFDINLLKPKRPSPIGIGFLMQWQCNVFSLLRVVFVELVADVAVVQLLATHAAGRQAAPWPRLSITSSSRWFMAPTFNFTASEKTIIVPTKTRKLLNKIIEVKSLCSFVANTKSNDYHEDVESENLTKTKSYSERGLY